MTNPFTEDYYLRGPQSALSNYENYRWLPEQTIPATKRIMEFLGMRIGETVLDFGCARGYYVKAFRFLGVHAYGYDISEWAIKNCDPAVSGVVSNGKAPFSGKYDYVTAKDVCEHIEPEELTKVISGLVTSAAKAVLVIVPLVDGRGEYISPADRQDATHKIRWTMDQWLHALDTAAMSQGRHHTTVSGCYRVPGLKEAAPPFSTAFIKIEHFNVPVDCAIS